MVSGIAGISQQNKAAAAQKQVLASQQEQQALQAQLNYLALKNQQFADNLNDQIADATRTLQYQQTQNQLDAQQTMNDLAVANANFEANLSRSNAAIQQTLGDNQAQRQQSEADAQVRQQSLAAQGQANQEQDQATQALLKLLGEGGQQQSAIANILDQAAARGGVNEALSLLLGSDELESIRAGASLQRGQQVQDSRVANARGLEMASTGLNQADSQVAQGVNQLNFGLADFGATKAIQDANFSKAIADQGFATTKAANDASYKIGILSDQSSRFARDYLSQVNEGAVLRGAQLSNEALQAQANAIPKVGFFDYLGVGMNAYNTFRSMQPAQAPKVVYATKN